MARTAGLGSLRRRPAGARACRRRNRPTRCRSAASSADRRPRAPRSGPSCARCRVGRGEPVGHDVVRRSRGRQVEGEHRRPPGGQLRLEPKAVLDTDQPEHAGPRVLLDLGPEGERARSGSARRSRRRPASARAAGRPASHVGAGQGRSVERAGPTAPAPPAAVTAKPSAVSAAAIRPLCSKQ